MKCTNPNLVLLWTDVNNKLLFSQFVNLKKLTPLNENSNFSVRYQSSNSFPLIFSQFTNYHPDGRSSLFSSLIQKRGVLVDYLDKVSGSCVNLKTIIHKAKRRLVRVPCNGCLSCRIRKSSEWAVRCLHEFSTSGQVGCFLTLTYSNENLPKDGVLVRRHIQLFMKRLRIRLARTTGEKIKFLCVGEYGDTNKRPHYHLIIFGYDFPDSRKNPKNYFRSSSSKHKLRVDPLLSSLWTFGHSSIGELNYDTCKYVASYSLKKARGKVCSVNGVKEFIGSSLGLGREWLLQNFHDVYKNDYVVVKTLNSSFKIKPPRYYDVLMKKYYKDFFEDVIKKRLLRVNGELNVFEITSSEFLRLEAQDHNLKSSQKKRL